MSQRFVQGKECLGNHLELLPGPPHPDLHRAAALIGILHSMGLFVPVPRLPMVVLGMGKQPSRVPGLCPD